MNFQGINLPGMTTPGLLKMYEPIREALEVDDTLPDGRKVYGVREFPDWKAWASAIEAELDKRGVKYTKVQW